MISERDFEIIKTTLFEDPLPSNGETEIEARFGKYIHRKFIPGIEKKVYDQVLNYLLNHPQYNLLSESRTTDIFYTDTRGRTIRKSILSTDPIEEVYIIKDKQNKNFELYDYGIRFSRNIEHFLPNVPLHISETGYTRKKHRHKFLTPDSKFFLELTFVIDSKNVRSYEVELEMKEPVITDIQSLLMNMHKILLLIQDTEVPVSYNMQYKVKQSFNRLFDYRGKNYNNMFYPKPSDLTMEKLANMLGNNTRYSVTDKSDGERKFLLYNELGVFLINPPFDTYKANAKTLPKFHNSLFDGELITTSGNEKVYLIFDALFIGGKDIRKMDHKNRLGYAQEFNKVITRVSKLVKIKVKSFYFFDNPMTMYEGMNKVYMSLDNLPYNNDGIILTPDNQPYKNVSIYKQKPEELKTIDFIVKEGKPYSYTSKNDNDMPVLELFTGTDEYPIDIDNLIIYDPFDSEGVVWEFGYSSSEQTFKPHRVRGDRTFPNFIEVAKKIWTSIYEPVNMSTLRGVDIALYSYYIDTIKSNIIDSIYGKNILDIGTCNSNIGNMFKKKQIDGTALLPSVDITNMSVLSVDDPIPHDYFNSMTSFLSLNNYDEEGIDVIFEIFDKSIDNKGMFSGIYYDFNMIGKLDQTLANKLNFTASDNDEYNLYINEEVIGNDEKIVLTKYGVDLQKYVDKYGFKLITKDIVGTKYLEPSMNEFIKLLKIFIITK